MTHQEYEYLKGKLEELCTTEYCEYTGSDADPKLFLEIMAPLVRPHPGMLDKVKEFNPQTLVDRTVERMLEALREAIIQENGINDGQLRDILACTVINSVCNLVTARNAGIMLREISDIILTQFEGFSEEVKADMGKGFDPRAEH